MKYTIHGFNQEVLLKLGLDSIDALILRYFIDFKDSGSMTMEIHNEKPYYWVKYDVLMNEIPIIGINNSDTLRRRLKKLEDCGVLSHYHKKVGGRFSFYTIGPYYKSLISQAPIEKSDDATQKSEGYDSKVGRDTTQKSEQNIHLLKDSSIKDSSIYKQVIDYLNKQANTSYKHESKKTQQLINSKTKEGFSLNDFIKVIDNKCSDWKGTEWEKYLRPETLFGNKFENYLNQKRSGVKSVNESNFNNFEQRTYDYDALEKKLLGWDS